MYWVLGAIFACGPRSADPGPECSVQCPVGTRVATGTEVEVRHIGGFVYSDKSCETVCEPFQPCLPPNIPTVVDQDGTHVFTCDALEGFSEIPDLAGLDPLEGTWLASSTANPVSVSGGLGLPATWSAVGDFDGDGLDDVVVGDGLWRATLLGGAGPAGTAEASEVHAAQAVDVDADGISELLVSFELPDGTISVRIERWGPSWVAETALFDTGLWPNAGELPDAADVDGDGWVDLVLTLNGGPEQGPNVAWGEPGGFGPLVWVGVQPCADCLEPLWLGDLDGDGLLDLVGRQPVFLEAGRIWRSGGALPSPPGSCVSADIDGDGRDDAICHDFVQTQVRRSDGLGGLAVVATMTWACLPPVRSTLVHDLDGDGADEVWLTTDCDDTLILHPLEQVVELRALSLAQATLVSHEGRLLAVTP